MNSLTLSVEQLRGGRQVVKDGLRFTEVSFVKLLIDGEDLEAREPFRDAWVYFEELEQSASASGRYLLFTCACGIAEDGGWEGVDVTVNASTVSWRFDAGAEQLHFLFDREDYASEIAAARAVLRSGALPLVPRTVIFPERFRR